MKEEDDATAISLRDKSQRDAGGGQRGMEWMEEEAGLLCLLLLSLCLSLCMESVSQIARAAQWGRNQVMRETAGNWNSKASTLASHTKLKHIRAAREGRRMKRLHCYVAHEFAPLVSPHTHKKSSSRKTLGPLFVCGFPNAAES